MLYQLEIPFSKFTPEDLKAIQDHFKEKRGQYGFNSRDRVSLCFREALKGKPPHSSVMIGLINDMRVLFDYFRFFVVFPDTKEMSMDLMLMYDKAIKENPDYNFTCNYEFKIGEGYDPTDLRPFLNITYEKEISRK